jgi:two-component system response regulator AtoC
LVEAAEGGTLFIDEVAELSGRVQAKLLRFAQDGEFRRVGDTAPRRASVRILTATNVKLAERGASSDFRPDLMYRLCDCELHLPPLRERGDDIPRLAHHFAGSFAAQHGRPIPRIPAAVRRTLERYAWPGNVRQLRSEMRRLVVFCGDAPVTAAQLSPEVQRGATDDGPVTNLRAARLDFERGLIAKALARHRGNRVRTAAALGLTRQGLLVKIQQHGLA